MRFASINMQKGLKTAKRRALFDRWLEVWAPDVLLLQEPCAHGQAPPSTLGDYRFVCGNTHVASYVRPSVEVASTDVLHERAHSLRIADATVCNVYFPHESRSARAAMFRLLTERLENRDRAKTAVFGDFNMAPRPEDGRYGEKEAKSWTGADERLALRELREHHDLMDLFSERAPGVEPFTFERQNRGEQSRFRCDFVLTSREWSHPADTSLYVAHETRRGSAPFTDHSAIILDAPVTTPCQEVHSVARDAPKAQPTFPTHWRCRSPVEFVRDATTLRICMEEVSRHPIVGLDVETEIYKKAPRLCLIQLAVPDRVLVIDALAFDDLQPIRRILEESRITKVIHHATAERTALGRLGFRIINVYDTEMRSRHLHGGRSGHTLSEVCQRELGAAIDKSNQRSDWTVRPLTAGQLTYAAIDAEVLLHLHTAFEKRAPTDGGSLLLVL